MNLETQINDGIKQAMLSKEKVRLAALRAIKAEILLAKTADGSDEISDAAVLKIIQKLVKRKESATVYAENNRPELAENELAEATCLEVFLPKQIEGAELETVLQEIITQAGAKSAADLGKVMGLATKKLAGQADGRQIAETVKRLLR